MIDECLTFLFAGSDTIASSLSWVFYYLCQDPEIFKKAREEADKLLDAVEETAHKELVVEEEVNALVVLEEKVETEAVEVSVVVVVETVLVVKVEIDVEVDNVVVVPHVEIVVVMVTKTGFQLPNSED